MQLFESAKQEDIIANFLHDFIDKYADRIDNYKSATLDLVENEAAPLGELVANLTGLGDSGDDVLQSLSVNQMALREIALVEQCGDEKNSYIPKYSVLTNSEIQAVRALCNEPEVESPEADTTKIMIVGLPNGIFDKQGINDDFNIRIAYTDTEYPQLVFRTKNYKFNKDLYVLADDLETTRVNDSSNRFSDILENMKFSKVRVEVEESSDSTASIELVDDIKKMSFKSSEPDIYVNLADRDWETIR